MIACHKPRDHMKRVPEGAKSWSEQGLRGWKVVLEEISMERTAMELVYKEYWTGMKTGFSIEKKTIVGSVSFKSEFEGHREE